MKIANGENVRLGAHNDVCHSIVVCAPNTSFILIFFRKVKWLKINITDISCFLFFVYFFFRAVLLIAWACICNRVALRSAVLLIYFYFARIDSCTSIISLSFELERKFSCRNHEAWVQSAAARSKGNAEKICSIQMRAFPCTVHTHTPLNGLECMNASVCVCVRVCVSACMFGGPVGAAQVM